jgi:hypothetical protein
VVAAAIWTLRRAYFTSWGAEIQQFHANSSFHENSRGHSAMTKLS